MCGMQPRFWPHPWAGGTSTVGRRNSVWIFLRPRCRIWSKLLPPCSARPPRVPSLLGDDVNIRMPAIFSELYILSCIPDAEYPARSERERISIWESVWSSMYRAPAAPPPGVWDS